MDEKQNNEANLFTIFMDEKQRNDVDLSRFLWTRSKRMKLLL